MMIQFLLLFLSFFFYFAVQAQDTFSIVALDPETGEVGSAGASCVDLVDNMPFFPEDFLGELFPGIGAINTQAGYSPDNQEQARLKMKDGYTPQEIVDWLAENDVQFNPSARQYGVVAFHADTFSAAAFTGSNTIEYAGDIVGPNYAIQGNVISGPEILEQMEIGFLETEGSLACRLMAAMQAANVVGADTRCAPNNSSSLFAFLKVAEPGNDFNVASFSVSVSTPEGAQIEPIDSLQTLFSAALQCPGDDVVNSIENKYFDEILRVYPNPAEGLLTVYLKSNAPATVHLVDMQGRVVYHAEFTQKMNVRTTNFTKGVYLLYVITEGKTMQSKVMIQ